MKIIILMKNLVIKTFFLIFFLFLKNNFLFPHDVRYDNLRDAKLPEVFFSGERFQEITSNMRNTNQNEKIQQIEKALEEYYSQFYEEKRIDYEKNSKDFFGKKDKRKISFFYRTHSGKILPSSNVNDIRVFHAETNQLFGPSFLIRDSETLHTLHVELAKAYKEIGQNHKAQEHYLAAFRYVDFSLSEENFQNLDKREILNSQIKTKLENHWNKKKEYENAKQELQKKIDEFHQKESEALRNSLKNRTIFVPNELNVKQLEENFKQKEKEYQTSLNENYLPSIKQRNEKLAVTLLDFALLTKEQENIEKIFRYMKESYPVHEINLKDFPSYLRILEFSNRLDPENPEILFLIAEEYKSISKKNEALTYYLKYDALPKERFSQQKPKLDVSLKIAQLYTELKKPVLATSYYERYFENLEDKQKKDFSFSLGEFFEKRIGNLEKSALYYKKFLTQENLNSEIEIYQTLVSNLGVAKFYKQIRNPNLEDEYLNKAYQNYKLLESKLFSQEKEIEKQKEEVSKLKKSLLYNTLEETLNEYRDKEKLLGLEIEKYKELKNLYDKIPKIELFIQLTKRSDEKRDYKKEKEYFREILNFGKETEILFALKNLERIDKIEKDGIFRSYIEK